MLESKRRASGMTLTKAVAEMVDNGFDAGATIVSIERSDDTITVRDDGKGCINEEALLGYGQHRAAAGRRGLGRYGIGLKDGAVWLGNDIQVISRTNDGVIKTIANWQEIIDSGLWDVYREEDPDLLPSLEGPTFTDVVIGSVSGRKFRNWKDLNSNLAAIFFPALNDGKRILIDGKLIQPPVPVVLLEEVLASGEFEGKGWRLRAGKLPSLSAPQGYTITYKHRVLVTGYESAGLGDYTANHIYCLLSLHDGPQEEWKLGSWKDDVERLDDLLDSIYPKIEHLLKKTSETLHNIDLRSMERQLEKMFNEGVIGREKRGKGDQKGTVDPKGSGKTRQTATHVSNREGTVTERDGSSPISRVLVHLEPRGGKALGHAYGTTKQMHVVIDLDHPFGKIAQKDLSLSAYIVCASVAAFAQLGPKQLVLPFDMVSEEVTGFDHFRLSVNEWLEQTSLRLFKEVA